MTESRLAPYEVPVSRWKYVLELGLHALLFLFSVLLVVTGLVERDSGLLPDALMTVAGLLFGPGGFILPVEIAPVLLLAAIIGAIVLVREK